MLITNNLKVTLTKRNYEIKNEEWVPENKDINLKIFFELLYLINNEDKELNKDANN